MMMSKALLPLILVLTLLSSRANSAEQTLYLHSIGGQLSLDSKAPIAEKPQSISSAPIGRESFKEIGKWNLARAPVAFELVRAASFQGWLGRLPGQGESIGDTGTFFDLRAEILLNGTAIPGAIAEVRDLRNIKPDPTKPKPVSLRFNSFPTTFFARGDILSLRVFAKVSEQGGKPTAPGATLFFDSVDRAAQISLSSFLVPEISVVNAAVDEGNSGNTDAQITVRLEAVTERTVTVEYETTDGTATLADGDYTHTTGPLSFPPGETEKPIHLSVHGDLLNEQDETVLVNLSHPVYAVLGPPGRLTIRNDDPEPELRINDATSAEGNSGTSTVDLTVSLSAVSGQMVSVDYVTADGTATVADNDYATANGTLILDPGESSKTITVVINGDLSVESDETVRMDLSNAVHASIATATGTITIQNDDTAAAAPVITSPSALALFNTSNITVTGTIDIPDAIVEVNGLPATVSEGVFTAPVTLREGNNVISVVAYDSRGNSATSSIQVTLDTTPPRLSIDSPREGAVLSDPHVTVTGTINDTVVGTVNADQATVDVNGTPAEVANRTYVAMNIQLVPGINTITSTGRDRVGNTRTVSIGVTYNNNPAARIQPVSGDGQSAQIGQLLPEPLIVRAIDNNGSRIADKKVIFKVTQNDGLITSGPNTARSLIVITDADGLAQVQFRLGTRAGAGNNQVSAAIVGLEGEVMFCASATPSAPGLLVPDAGNNQIGVASQALPRPLVTIVVDSGNNRLHDVPITFSVKEGGGTFGGERSVTISSDSDGRALVLLTLGPNAGNDNNIVEANFAGNTGLPVAFVASGRIPGDPAETSISGVVLDNSDQPVPGTTLRILGFPDAVLSDDNGFFQFKPAPVGAVRLIADGATVTRPGRWVWLQFDLVTIAGQDNDIGRPVRLLPMDLTHALPVDETHGGTLTLPQAPGYSLTIVPGSVLFPDGTRNGLVSVTIVHPDKMPDPPSFGQQPRFLVSIQPANAIFNPPAAMCIPNLDGLPPGQKTDMYSYDHEMERFISIGTGTISEDGTMLCSDPGNGVIKGGWHCGGNPATAGSAGTCQFCQKCEGNNCVPDASKNGQISPTDKCKVCNNGNLTSIPLQPGIKITIGGIGPPAPAVDKIKEALEELKKIGIIAKVNLLQVTLNGTSKECCEATLGKGQEVSASVTGDVGGFSGRGKVWPPAKSHII